MRWTTPLWKKERKMRKHRRSVFKILLILLVILFLLIFAYFYSLSYRGLSNWPVRYGKEITEAAERNGLDPHLVCAIVKTESDFRPTVVAEDGGHGLMQIMPETGKNIAHDLGMDYSKEALLDVQTNLQMGTYYFSRLLQKYQSEDLAIAAYNGGTNQVDGWLDGGTINWQEDSMENIPVEVTRNYVRKVNQAKKIYSILYPDQLPEDTSSFSKTALALEHLSNVWTWAFEGL